jgi:2-phosphoglycerate kinase
MRGQVKLAEESQVLTWEVDLNTSRHFADDPEHIFHSRRGRFLRQKCARYSTLRGGGSPMGNETGMAGRDWQVLLIGGASGVGKTAVSYRVAERYGVGITEVDDFQVLLEAMTTPEQLPAVHVWRTNPDSDKLADSVIVEQLLTLSRVMLPGLQAVVSNHLETQTPIVLEGDFLLPALAERTRYATLPGGARVRGVFLHEPEEEQFLRNYLLREPDRGPQIKRARVSWLHGQWLKQEAEQRGVPVVPARPWDTVFERIVATLS